MPCVHVTESQVHISKIGNACIVEGETTYQRDVE